MRLEELSKKSGNWCAALHRKKNVKKIGTHHPE
jgi:hypothetical protein